MNIGAANAGSRHLDADVSSSTKSAKFGKEYPDRFFNVGVAEGNLAGMAAGLATCGYHPVINAFAIFLSLKSLDQIRNDMCYNSLPVVIAGAYGGLSDSFDGASHQAIEDIAIFRSIPNMEVIVPSDARQAELALEYALGRKNPVYIRLNRNEMPDIDTDKDAFFAGKAVKVREGKDVTIAANGITASMAVSAADLLAAKGIKVYKTLVGEYMTSLEMEGFSISLLRLDDQMKELLDAEADTPAMTVAK